MRRPTGVIPVFRGIDMPLPTPLLTCQSCKEWMRHSRIDVVTFKCDGCGTLRRWGLA